MSLIQAILEATQRRTKERSEARPVAELERMILDAPPPRQLSAALLRQPLSLIAEVKVQSPSGGKMNPRNVERAPKAYENAPAVAAVSVITNHDHFGGSLERLWEVRKSSTKPLLRKDFITDPYQVIEARAFGADAVLLMASLFPGKDGRRKLRDLFKLVRRLNMEALVEIGMGEMDVREMVRLVPSRARIWGINSRVFHSHTRHGLRARLSRTMGNDFTTSNRRHEQLRSAIPKGRIAVAESGLNSPQDLEHIHSYGYNAALIGTAFLKRGRTVEEEVTAFSEKVLEINSRLA